MMEVCCEKHGEPAVFCTDCVEEISREDDELPPEPDLDERLKQLGEKYRHFRLAWDHQFGWRILAKHIITEKEWKIYSTFQSPIDAVKKALEDA